MGFVGVVSLTALPLRGLSGSDVHSMPLMLPWEHMRLACSPSITAAERSPATTPSTRRAVVFPAMLASSGSGNGSNGLRYFDSGADCGLAFAATEKGSIVFGPVSPRPARLIREGFPYLFSVVAADLFARLDVFLILWLASFAVQGYYAAAVPAANLLIVAPNALALFAFNAGAASGPARSLRQVLAAAAGVAAFQTLAAVAFAALLPALIGLVFGRDFLGQCRWPTPLPAYALNGCAGGRRLSARTRNGGRRVRSRWLAP